MRHRIGIAACTGLGLGPGTGFNIDNMGLEKFPSELLRDISNDFAAQFSCLAIDTEGCDFGWLTPTVFCCGFEPAYQWQRLLVFQFDFENTEKSGVAYGTAFGYYGTEIALRYKELSDYKKHGKYAKFIEKWYSELKKYVNENY